MIRRPLARAGSVAVGLLALTSSGRAEAQVAFQPGIATIPDGVAMTAVPAVSADRRYVRLSVNPSFQTVDGFTTVPIPFGVSGLGSGTGLGALGGLGGAGGGAAGGGGGGVAGVAMGMNGPVAGGNHGEAGLSGDPTVFAGAAPGATTDPLASSFDRTFRSAPPATPSRSPARSARTKRPARPRGKTAGTGF